MTYAPTDAMFFVPEYLAFNWTTLELKQDGLTDVNGFDGLF